MSGLKAELRGYRFGKLGVPRVEGSSSTRFFFPPPDCFRDVDMRPVFRWEIDEYY